MTGTTRMSSAGAHDARGSLTQVERLARFVSRSKSIWGRVVTYQPDARLDAEEVTS
jgi:hypothetical protein